MCTPVQAQSEGRDYALSMAIERDEADERRLRIATMIDEFRAAQQRRLQQQGIAMWKQAEAAELGKVRGPRPAPEKIH